MKHPLLPFLFLVLAAAAPMTGRAQAPASSQAPALAAPQGKVSTPSGAIDISKEPIVRVVANVQPAVVHITAEATVPDFPYNSFFSQYGRRHPRTEQSIGSGLIISADGFILTNAHVVALAEQGKSVGITLQSGSKYKAQIISADDDADLALLKIEDQTVQFPYFDLAYTSPNLLGETVVALGSPAGYQNSVSHGILSAKNRTFSVQENGYTHDFTNLLQTDAAINPGNSGGPLVDINGGLVGINSAKLSGDANGETIEDIGFAIPSEIVVPWANDAMAVARGLKPASVNRDQTLLQIVRDHLGLGLKTLTSEEADELGTDMNGMLITDVQEQSPAADAGLRKNMIVTAIGNRQVTDEKTLPRELENLQPGTNVRVHVVYVQSAGPFMLQRGGSVMLVSR
jgi:S1-C subfamily serine protease